MNKIILTVCCAALSAVLAAGCGSNVGRYEEPKNPDQKPKVDPTEGDKEKTGVVPPELPKKPPDVK